MRQLLAARADVDAELRISGRHDLSALAEAHSKTPLYLAAEKGHAAVARCLLEHRADTRALALIETEQAWERTREPVEECRKHLLANPAACSADRIVVRHC